MNPKTLFQKKEFYLIIPVILLLTYLLIRLINQAQMIQIFPIDAYANDYSSHIARLWFLAKYGLHQPIQHWYNGNYTLLTHYPPLWYILTLPIYKLTQNPQSAAFISLVLMYISSFAILIWFGKTQNLSKISSAALFFFFFANPIAIGYFLRLGKLPEMLGWLFSFIFLAIIFWYKNHKLDWKFILLIPVYALIHYSHVLVFIAVSIPLISLFLIKKTREKIIIAVSVIATAIITFPFWSIFTKNMSENKIGTYFSLHWLIQPGNMTDKITSIIVPVMFLTIFYLYYKSIQEHNTTIKHKELLFYLPIIFFSILYAARLACFIPIINRPTPDTYNFLLIFISSFLFLKINFRKLKLQKYIAPLLIIVVIIGIILSTTLTTPFKPHTQEVKDTLKILEDVDYKFRISENPPSVNGRAITSYAPIYLNLSTPGGWASLNLSKEYIDLLSAQTEAVKSKDCVKTESSMRNLQTKELITFNEYCYFLESCGFQKKKQINNVCLYIIYGG
ncbi:MAG: EpsG family protein [Nanoarchaeota archaeon]|nr:EpsG family protein [Nanoarchaeota archaeon]